MRSSLLRPLWSSSSESSSKKLADGAWWGIRLAFDAVMAVGVGGERPAYIPLRVAVAPMSANSIEAVTLVSSDQRDALPGGALAEVGGDDVLDVGVLMCSFIGRRGAVVEHPGLGLIGSELPE